MSPWLSHLSCWVQLLLKNFHWDKPAIVISHWNESLVVPSFPLRDKGVAEYIFEMRMSIKPEIPTFNLTCNFLLKYKIHSLLIFPIEMNPWLSLLSRWERQRSCRLCIQNEDVHIARNSYFIRKTHFLVERVLNHLKQLENPWGHFKRLKELKLLAAHWWTAWPISVK